MNKLLPIKDKKNRLPVRHIEKINMAVRKGLGADKWELLGLLSGGLTGIPVYRIQVGNESYAIKLEEVKDKDFDLKRSYKILEMVSKQGFTPTVYFTEVDQGIILMKYVESKPRLEVSPETIQKFACVLRELHEKNTFPKWKSVVEILDLVYQRLTPAYKKSTLIKKSMQEINKMTNILFEPNDIRSCHCDLNPTNVLFDGERYLFVDWQAASPQSFYFDLAYYANWFYFYNEDLSALFLKYYFGREVTDEENAKYYLMRVFAFIYLGVGFISLPFKVNKNIPILSGESIEKLPSYLKFMQSLGSGKVDLENPDSQQQFGYILLIAAIKMMDQRYKYYYEFLLNKK